MPIYTRTPTLLAMTAAGLDYVSDGRFRLGIGTSGPQVMEGFHGVPFDAPLGRTREVVEICRQVWRRENVQFDGKHYQLPLPPDRGTGLGKPLHLINHPVRERIPITIAALGPKECGAHRRDRRGLATGVLLSGEGRRRPGVTSLRSGMPSATRSSGRSTSWSAPRLAIGDDVDDRLAWAKPQLALYIGGMGARGKNFYHNLATRYGFGEVADHIQDLYLAGKKPKPSTRFPTSWCAPSRWSGRRFRQRTVAAFAEAGVTTLLVHPLTGDRRESVRFVEELHDLLP